MLEREPGAFPRIPEEDAELLNREVEKQTSEEIQTTLRQLIHDFGLARIEREFRQAHSRYEENIRESGDSTK